MMSPHLYFMKEQREKFCIKIIRQMLLWTQQGMFIAIVNWYIRCGIDKLKRNLIMLNWVFLFLIVAIIAGVFGFTGIAASAAGIAKILFVIFLVLFLLSLVMHLFRK